MIPNQTCTVSISGKNTAVQFPIFRQFNGWLGRQGNLIIERQDRRMVVTQHPASTELGIGEIMIQGENPIVLYRKIRRALL